MDVVPLAAGLDDWLRSCFMGVYRSECHVSLAAAEKSNTDLVSSVQAQGVMARPGMPLTVHYQWKARFVLYQI